MAGTDYTATTATWTIGRGSRSTQVRVPILADTVAESRERFRAIAGIDSGNARFDNGELTATATGLIDDRPPGVSLNVDDLTAPGRGQRIQVPVRKVGTTTETVYFTADTEPLTSGSIAGADEYNALSNARLSIPANRSSTSVPVTIPFRRRTRE